MKKIIALVLVASLYSCTPQLYIPIVSVEKSSVNDLLKGRTLYVKNCASCHQLYSPNKYNNTKWTDILNKMQRKAKIDDTQKQLIYDYLVNAPKKK